jgi:hypothetical protein
VVTHNDFDDVKEYTNNLEKSIVPELSDMYNNLSTELNDEKSNRFDNDEQLSNWCNNLSIDLNNEISDINNEISNLCADINNIKIPLNVSELSNDVGYSKILIDNDATSELNI